MRKFQSGQDREMLLGCFPFSKPETMKGVWFTGFEANTFYEGERASPDLLKRYLAPPDAKTMRWGRFTTLVFGRSGNPDIPSDGKLRVFQIDFVGRRGTCPAGPERTIVVDRVLSSTFKGVVE